jgi:thymidylate kinase
MGGRLIVFEGLDGVGKSTVARRVAESLGATLLATPARELAPLRALVDEHVGHSPEARQLFYAATVLSLSDFVRPLLAAGTDVVVDRYWFSTLAYGEAVRCVHLELGGIERRLVRPHATVWLEADRTVREARQRARGRNTADDHTTLVPEVDSRLCDAYARLLRRPFAGTVLRVRADASPAAVTAAVLEGLDADTLAHSA